MTGMQSRWLLVALGLVGVAGGVFFALSYNRSAEAPVYDGADDPGAPPPGERLPGRWRRARPRGEATPLTPEQQEAVERLESIGYAAGTRAARAEKSVTVFEPDRAFPGYNLYTSGHFPGAILMDMEGKVLHRWELRYEDAFPGVKLEKYQSADFWRRVFLFPNGDLLAIFEGIGIIKLDKDSNLIWATRNRAHHDLEVLPNGDIYVLTRKADLIPSLHPSEPILEDFVTLLDANGNEKRTVSLVECLSNSGYRSILQESNLGAGDIFHTNTVRILSGRASWYEPGNVLVSMRNINVVGVVDLEKRTMPQAWVGSFKSQHDPRLLPNGHILLFDNLGGPGGKSRVVEFDPVDSRLHWSYSGTRQEPLDSPTLGGTERLPNGNTLITESDNGRAIEVTPAKVIVWEFMSPHTVGPNDEYVASLFEMKRLSSDFPASWIEPATAGD